MNPTELLRVDILMDLAHDDVGLWEVAWRARTLFPVSDPEEQGSIAYAAVDGLVMSGEAILLAPEAPDTPVSLLGIWRESRGWLGDPPDTRLWLAMTATGEIALSALDPALVRELTRSLPDGRSTAKDQQR